MHHTFIRPATAVTLASLLISVHSAVAPRQAVPSGGYTCVDDALYDGFFSNTQGKVTYAVQTLCSSILQLSDSTVCDHSLTTSTTTFPAGTSITRTSTATTTTYDSTITVTETGVVLGLSGKMKARDAAPAPKAQITAAPKFARDILRARAVEKRQSNATESDADAISSACECGYLAGIVTADTIYQATCFPFTQVSSSRLFCFSQLTLPDHH